MHSLHLSPTPFVVAWLVAVALVIVPHVMLWRRTGHSGWWAVLMLVPLVNIASVWVLALRQWPIDAEEQTD